MTSLRNFTLSQPFLQRVRKAHLDSGIVFIKSIFTSRSMLTRDADDTFKNSIVKCFSAPMHNKVVSSLFNQADQKEYFFVCHQKMNNDTVCEYVLRIILFN